MLFSGTKVLQAKCPSIPPVPADQLEPGFRCAWDFALPKQSTGHSAMPVMAMVLRTGT